MPVESSGNFAKLLWPGLNALWGLSYAKQKYQYPEIFEEYKSKKAFEEDQGLTGYGLAQVMSEGDAVNYDSSEVGYNKRYTHVTYGLGFIITRNMYEDDQYSGPMRRHVDALTFSMHTTKDTVCANVLNRAFSNSYTGGDSVELCATTHPYKGGGTWQNEPTNPADLTETALEQACIDIGKFKNDRQLHIPIKPMKLIIPVDLQFQATRILESTLQNNTANNAVNALKFIGAIKNGYVINDYLTDTDAWFVKTDCPDGFKYFNRRPDEFRQDNDFDTENAKYKGTTRFSVGWTDPRCVYGSPGV